MTLRRATPFWARKKNSGGFLPSDLAGLELWYDVTDFSSLTFNGSNISQINDKSGNLRHASQATSANQPLYNTTGLNGQPSLTFDGTNDNLQSTTFNLGALPLCCFVVMKGDPSQLGAAVSYLQASSSTRYFALLGNTTQGKCDAYYRNGGSTGIRSSSESPESPYNGDIFYYEKLSNNLNVIKKERIVSPTDNGNFTLVETQAYGSFDKFVLGVLRIVSPANYYKGEISEVILYSVSPSTSDKNQVFDYLSNKYSLTAPIAL